MREPHLRGCQINLQARFRGKHFVSIPGRPFFIQTHRIFQTINKNRPQNSLHHLLDPVRGSQNYAKVIQNSAQGGPRTTTVIPK